MCTSQVFFNGAADRVPFRKAFVVTLRVSRARQSLHESLFVRFGGWERNRERGGRRLAVVGRKKRMHFKCKAKEGRDLTGSLPAPQQCTAAVGKPVSLMELR